MALYRAQGGRTLDDRVLSLLQSLEEDVTPKEMALLVALLVGVHSFRRATLEEVEAALARLVAAGRAVEVT